MTKRSEIEKRRGLVPGDYEWLLGAGGGACWICKRPPTEDRRLAIDHDHATGAVRGLLCSRCNQAIGAFNDDPELLRAASEYLDRSRAVWSDACSDCRDGAIYPPAGVVESSGENTRFGYVCARGHVWACGWRTFGVPFVWTL